MSYQFVGAEPPVASWDCCMCAMYKRKGNLGYRVVTDSTLSYSCGPLPQSAMIHNPQMEHYRYNPYSKVLTREHYDTPKMHNIRK